MVSHNYSVIIKVLRMMKELISVFAQLNATRKNV